MKIAAIVINYRTPDLTSQVVVSLRSELEKVGDFQIFVVDNCSGDDSLERLRRRARDEWDERVVVVAAPRNGGYGYGINLGVAEAKSRLPAPDYYFAINSDAFPDPGAIGTMVDFMESHGDAGMCGGSIHGVDGSDRAAAFRFPTAATQFNDAAKTAIVARLMPNHRVPMPLPKEATAVEWISGTCMMIRPALFDQIGGFDEGFFLYFEEVDFCRRAGRVGWRSYCLPTAKVTHLGSVSTGMDDNSRPMPTYWFESRHRYLRKHHGRTYSVLCDVSWAAGFGLRQFKNSLLGRARTHRPRLFIDFVHNGLRNLLDANEVGPDDAVHAPETVASIGGRRGVIWAGIENGLRASAPFSRHLSPDSGSGRRASQLREFLPERGAASMAIRQPAAALHPAK